MHWYGDQATHSRSGPCRRTTEAKRMSAQPELAQIGEGTFDLASVNSEAPLTLRPLALAPGAWPRDQKLAAGFPPKGSVG